MAIMMVYCEMMASGKCQVFIFFALFGILSSVRFFFVQLHHFNFSFPLSNVTLTLLFRCFCYFERKFVCFWGFSCGKTLNYRMISCLIFTSKEKYCIDFYFFYIRTRAHTYLYTVRVHVAI